jgi:hypothetical protein
VVPFYSALVVNFHSALDTSREVFGSVYLYVRTRLTSAAWRRQRFERGAQVSRWLKDRRALSLQVDDNPADVRLWRLAFTDAEFDCSRGPFP